MTGDLGGSGSSRPPDCRSFDVGLHRFEEGGLGDSRSLAEARLPFPHVPDWRAGWGQIAWQGGFHAPRTPSPPGNLILNPLHVPAAQALHFAA